MWIHSICSKKNKKYCLILLTRSILFCILLVNFSYGQSVNSESSIDTNVVKIGQPIKLHLQVAYPPGAKIEWPNIKDSLGKLEVIGRSKIDTIQDANSNTFLQRQTIQLTSFDSGNVVIPSLNFTYTIGKDTNKLTSFTRPHFVSIQGIAVDTTQEIKDIKAPIEVPFTFVDFIKEYGIFIGVGILLTALAIALYFYLKKRPKKPMEVPVISSRPAHEIALESLEKIEKEKLWQQGQIKLFYTKISDTIRTYIENRYKVNAMELTKDETLTALNTIIKDSESKNKLDQILTLSDLVKFAKVNPIPSENEITLINGFDFIKETKPVVLPPQVRKEETP